MSVEYDRIRSKVKAIEAIRPSTEESPEGHREANEQISRLIDRSRMFADAERARKVPL
ncbi:hypothetical protein LAC81_01970 [Ensifer adhaerens]|uniref:hypothetical protein n=1 Tax=Ensifer adhaerens TaxID=106592 RepID=UPI001CC1440A|nr:hypothetical protein [Ensifer adhaerens]MBZ7920553.1 hypothetical protein [Ensifer adhaerens]UAX93029.1 hypothetical protein LAC78_01965 [Ensifer adhaerens]UAY00665.1 hypothetical protein LAC80_01970 [Ensifer adhaerens]UAY08046.1 hypothetical protein LAC81_01970 [Ensifer adhaerens]